MKCVGNPGLLTQFLIVIDLLIYSFNCGKYRIKYITSSGLDVMVG